MSTPRSRNAISGSSRWVPCTVLPIEVFRLSPLSGSMWIFSRAEFALSERGRERDSHRTRGSSTSQPPGRWEYRLMVRHPLFQRPSGEGSRDASKKSRFPPFRRGGCQPPQVVMAMEPHWQLLQCSPCREADRRRRVYAVIPLAENRSLFWPRDERE